MAEQNYPPLSTLLPNGGLPESLGAVGESAENLIDRIRYRNLIVETSPDNDAKFYSLTLIAKELALDLFGSGLKLILFPAEESSDPIGQGSSLATSELDIVFEYSWAIRKYVPDFEILSFAGSAKAFFEVFLELVDITEAEFLTGIIEAFIDDPAPYQALVDKLKQWQGGSSPLSGLTLANPPVGYTEIEYLVQQITAVNVDLFGAVFETVIEDLNNLAGSLERLVALFQGWLGAISIDDIKELLIPQISVVLGPLAAGIQFPSTILREVNALGKPVPDPLHPAEDKPARLAFDVATLKYSTARGFEFELVDSLNFNFPRSEILKSGLILELHEVKIDFSRTTNIPEAIADGRPPDFVGVYVKDGTITFPTSWQHDSSSTGVVKAKNLLIGTGGFSGTLSLEGVTLNEPSPVIKIKFGKDFSISLDKFSLTLKQNAIKESTIEGMLMIPGFKDVHNNPAEIRIKVAIRQDGDFDITAHEEDGFKEIIFPNVFTLTLKSVLFGKQDDDFYLGVSGSIKFTATLLKDIAPIEVEKLIIWSDGRFEIEGGTIPLPKNIRFPIGPAELSISAVNLGSHQQDDGTGRLRKYRYVGFDGGVDLNPGGLNVRGRGIKFFFTVDGPTFHSYLEIKSLAIDLVIPGNASKDSATLLISGFLSIGGTKADPAYEGGVSFALPKVKIAGGASMQLRPKKAAFIVDAFVELSTPIPLGATSLGIYGFRGLFGQRYVASKAKAGLTETNTWFDYYKVKAGTPPLEGVSISKFEGPSQTKNYDGAVSIGAGLSLATVQDSGKTFSCKLFLLLSLPDLIYLEGKANILGERVGLTGEDPAFFAMLAISSQSVEMGIGVSYKIPRDGDQKGWILDLNAEMRAAFFFQNSSAWYINFGTIQNPTTARVLTLFNATAYVMLSAAGIAAGASVTFGFNKSYAGGSVRASVEVYIKVGGFISFQRPQIGGFAMLGGHVDVSLLRFSFYLSIDTSLSVEVPKPFYIKGSVHLCVGVKIFKKQIKKCFDVEFKWEKDPTVDLSPVLPIADVTNPNVLPPIIGTNMLSGESFRIMSLGTTLPTTAPDFNKAVLPLDSWVDLEFLKGLVPGPDVNARIGRLSGQAPTNTIDYIPPAQVANKVEHQYSINAVEIKAWNGRAWVDYRPYQAMSPPDALVALKANPSAYKDGFWQNSGAGFNKLRLLSETSFSYMQQGQPDWYVPEQFGITSPTLFCRTKLRDRRCIRWNDVAPGTVYPADAWRQTDTVMYRVAAGAGSVIDWNNPFDIQRSLAFPNEATAQIVFNQPCVEVNLKLTTFSSGAEIRFYKRETVAASFVYTLAETRLLTQLELLAPVNYNNPAVAVAKVEIDPLKGDRAAIYALQVRLDELHRQLYESNPDPAEREVLEEEIRGLEQQLSEATSQGCAPNGFDLETLINRVPVLQRQIEECRAQLSVMQAAQQAACRKSADVGALFKRCFPRVPSPLSYDIVRVLDPAVRARFQFVIYDDRRDAVLFNGALSYPDAATAEQAVFDTLELTVWPGDYALMAPRHERQYFFQLVDTSGRFTAVNPASFTAWDQLVAFWEETQAICRAAHADGTFSVARRVAGKRSCEERLDHLDCWTELLSFGAAGASNCETIVAGIRSARDSYCTEYNRLYDALYDCNKGLLAEAVRHCEELTRAVEIQHQACQALSEQLESIQEIISFIDQGGALLPPEGFPCSTLLHEACCLSLEDYEFNLSVPSQAAIQQDYADAVQGIEKMLTPIWRPSTKYCVHLSVTDTVRGAATPRHFYFGFRTAGPVGHFHTDLFAGYVDEARGRKAEQYPLTGLKGYIDDRRSYPNAFGELIGAKPLFYEDARILLFFTRRYAYHFFGDWPAYNGLPAILGSSMQIVIKDPAEKTSLQNPPAPQVFTTEIPQAVVSWPKDDDPRLPEDIRALGNLRNPELLNPDFVGGDCWLSGGEMIKPASVYTKVTPQYLKPLKLYTAIVNNVYNGKTKPVHDYVFQTSRYADFVAQVKSYRLDDGKGNQRDAVFRIDLPAADSNLMFDVVTGNMSGPNADLARIWADPFDRLVEGVMKLQPLDAAIGTEFNIVRNHTTNAVLAVWIRNPEPFNDPKLPDEVLARSLRVMDGLSPDLSYQVLFSKDRAQAFVMHPARVIPAPQMQFRFAYIEWNGSAYVDHAVVISDFIPTNI